MKTVNQQKVNTIIDIIKEMGANELVQLNNEYCEAINSHDSFIYDNEDEFLEDYFETKSELARAIHFGKYRYMDKYVIFNGYGNLESFNYMDIDHLCELVPVMAEYIAENLQDFTQFDEIENID